MSCLLIVVCGLLFVIRVVLFVCVVCFWPSHVVCSFLFAMCVVLCFDWCFVFVARLSLFVARCSLRGVCCTLIDVDYS